MSYSQRTATIKADGSVWICGWNDYGQLGDNTVDPKSSPVLVVGNHSFVEISLGVYSSLALKADGSVWAWGMNTSGECGDNTNDNRSSPVLVVGNHSFIKISCGGESFAMALKSDGTLWSWGSCYYWQLGDIPKGYRSSPALVAGGHTFIDVSAGSAMTIALKADGSAWTWGWSGGNNGALGHGTTNGSKSSPMLVIGDHSFVEVMASGLHMGARKADGSMWVWGSNAFSQLGAMLDAYTSTSSPVLVVGNHSFVEITVVGYNAGGRKADGSIWMWGYNGSGIVGDYDGTDNQKSSPVPIAGNQSYVEMIGAIEHMVARKADGSADAWGINSSGQLGNNTVDNASRIVPIIGGSFNRKHHFRNLKKLDPISLEYRTGATSAACVAASYALYTEPVDSLGWFQTRARARG